MKGNQEPMLYTTNATVAALNHVPGFDPLKFLRRTISRKTGEDVMRLDLRYKKLWFRLACPTGRLKLNALRITEKMAIFEAKVYRDREDAEPLSSYVANCTLDTTPGGLYVEAAQEEALDTALSNAGFGIQFADVGSESEEYGSEVPMGAKAEIAKPVQAKTETAKSVQAKEKIDQPMQKHPEVVKAAPEEPVKADPLDAIMADDMPVPEQVTAEIVEKSKMVVLESVQPAQIPAEPPQNVIVLEQEPPAAAYTQNSPVEEIRRQMTYEQAQNVIVDCGTCKGWTLAQVADRRPASLRWYVKGYQGREQHSPRGGRYYMGQLAGEAGGITGKEAVLHDLIFRYISVWYCRCGRTAGAYRPPPSAVEPVPELPLLRGAARAAQRQHGQKRLALQPLRCGGWYAGIVCPL